ncbi:MAG: hypothetical protein Q9174_002001 [Haloplaca sp. 1 TL-2023]
MSSNTQGTPNLQFPLEADESGDLHQYPEAEGPQFRRKPPRRPGLRVGFVDDAPTIIGEGGDEASLPAIEVFSSHNSTVSFSTGSSAKVSSQPEFRHDSEMHVTEDEGFRPGLLQRKSTGIQDHGSGEDKDLPQRPIASPSPIHEQIPGENPRSRRSLSAERGIAPQGRVQTDEGLIDHSWESQVGLQQIDISSHLLNPATSFKNSLTPSPSPYYLGEPRTAASGGYPFPAAPPVDDAILTSDDSQLQTRARLEHRPQIPAKASSDNRGFSLRDLAKSLGNDAYQDFAERVQHFDSLFRLGLDPRTEPSLQQWVMAASWWFLRGRSGLETSVRSKASKPATMDSEASDTPADLKQAYLNLAKTRWIISEMIPSQYPEVEQSDHKGPVVLSTVVQNIVHAKKADLAQTYLSIKSALRALSMSMRKNSKMPSPGIELHGLDARVFIAYPLLSPSAARLLSPEKLREKESISFFPMPIADTERHFNYGRIFVDMVLEPMKTGNGMTVPCLMSVLRDRKQRDIMAALASQDGQIQLTIESGEDATLSWHDVHWDVQQQRLDIDLRADFKLHIRFAEGDFKTLWGIHDHIRTVQKAGKGSRSEILLMEEVLRSFQWVEPANAPPQFPAGQVESCTLRLFECFTFLQESSGERRLHQGYRLSVVTPRRIKKLSSVSLALALQSPIIFSYLRDEQGAPAILLKTSKSSRRPYAVLGFDAPTGRDLLHSLLSGTALASGEQCSENLDLKAFDILTKPPEETRSDRNGGLNSFSARALKVYRFPMKTKQLGTFKTRLSIECETGSFMDRIDLGPGDFKIRLDVDVLTRISFTRPRQNDLTACFADTTLSRELFESMKQMLLELGRSPSVKRFAFHALDHLHAFQSMVTGFTVLFDGFAKTFAISRKRMVVPIHKRWEASVTRLQLVRREQTVQLLTFFKDFSHGSCMGFVLKGTDRFESFSRAGTAYLCIPDAKFAFPKSESEDDHDFVCLDTPEYPGEHDDITIGFESEPGMFCS